MSLKSFIAQVEASKQVSEAVAMAPTIGTTTSTATAPQQGQKVIVKPGQPQQSTEPQATITNQAGKVIAQADPLDAKKLGDLVNAGNVTMMDPMTGKPLEEDGIDEESQSYRDAMAMQRAAGINARADDAEARLAQRAAEPKTALQHAAKTFVKHAKDPLGLKEEEVEEGMFDSVKQAYHQNRFNAATSKIGSAKTQAERDALTAKARQHGQAANRAQVQRTGDIRDKSGYGGSFDDARAINQQYQVSESIMTAGKLDAILQNYPHEHKMAQEGWGMDSSLLEALTDHYHAEGRIPRAVWHGDAESLRKHVEECYAQDTGIVMETDDLDAQHSEWKAAVAQAHPGVQGIRTTSKPDSRELSAQVKGQDRSYGTFNTDTGKGQVLPEDTLEEVSELEKRLTQPTEESTMFESKKLKGDQAKLDANKNGKLDKKDFEALRSKKVDEAKEKEPEGTYSSKRHETDGQRIARLAKEKRQAEKKKTEQVDEATEETKTGRKHTADAGGYGRKHEDDTDDDGKKVKKDEPKKGRGRPKKGGDETGEVKKYNFDAMSSFGAGKKPKKEIGKVSKKHKIATKADSEKVDEAISKWDAQLRTLLEGKQINESKQVVSEGLSVSTSVGQEGAPDSVSITANDEDAHQLLALLNNAGMGSGVPGHAVRTNPAEELLKAHGASQDGGSFSTAGTEEPGDVEVVDFDTAQDGIESDDDGGMSAMKQMLAAMGIGKDSAPEPKHNEFDAGSDSEEATDSEEESDSEEKEQVVGEEWSEDKADEDYDDDGEVESEKEEHSGAVANAIDDSEESDDSEEESDEDKEKVDEGQQTCNECGSMYEGEGHECSHSDETQLNEWANSPQGQSEDEDFTATIEYFTKSISGGLNGQKKDQTTLPSTQVKVSEGYNIDVAAEMRKLAGIR